MSILLNSIITADAELLDITFLSLYVSLAGVFFSSLLAIPLGVILGKGRFPGRGLLLNLVNTFMGLPPVLVGLFLFLIFSRAGPLGPSDLLFTPEIMALAQFIIAFPIITGITVSTIKDVDKDMLQLISSLGSTRFQELWLLLFESRYGLLTAIIAGMGRAFSEVGAVIIVGGNIRYHTRVLTTSIVLETGRGEFERAMAQGIILLTLSFTLSLLLTTLRERTQG